jgi:hypothetical protein
MAIMTEFDPARDGWYFKNWGEAAPYCLGSCDLSWDLYRQTYLGIVPEAEKYEAPLDLAFYELFKTCAQKGNCGGMSLLALALYKFGGYMGFCSPANLYTGTKSPDREDLHRTINVLQAHQFSAAGIQNFLDAVDAGNLNDAEAAFHRAKELLGKGDYPLLSLAGNLIGENAHTLIPYRLDEQPSGQPPGTKVMYLWDSNIPYDANSNHYGSLKSQLVIRSSTDWSYISGISPNYTGGAAAWCFVIPMSQVLPKSRQPLAVDMVINALLHVFITGSGAAVSQISDDAGHRLFCTDADIHLGRDELETDPARRLAGAAPWPWFDLAQGGVPGELYFMRGHLGYKPLKITVNGTEYKLSASLAGHLIEVEGQARRSARDTLTFSGLATPGAALHIASEAPGRVINIRQLRTGITGGAIWRSIHLTNARVTRQGLTLRAARDLRTVEVESAGQEVTFNLASEQRQAQKTLKRDAGKISLGAGKAMRMTPEDWDKLKEREV